MGKSSLAIVALNSELEAAGDGLIGNDDVLRSVLAGSGDCIKILDMNGRLQFMSEGGKRVMEVEDFSKLKGCPWPDFWAGEGNAEAKKAVATAKAGGTARFKGEANTAKGTPRYWDVQVSPIFGEDGVQTHLLSISRDITDEFRATTGLKVAIERQRVLAMEMEHRVKNTLAMVNAIARQTIRGDIDAARKTFTDRLITLSHAHDMLTKTSWERAPIADIIAAALTSHGTWGARMTSSGPNLTLSPKRALALTLAFHELAMNAVKYGALSNEAGTVRIDWSVSDDELYLVWSESNGPPVVAPNSQSRGFGSRLLDKVLASSFDGKASLTFPETGVQLELRAPATAA